jgi:hypothetical protein
MLKAPTPSTSPEQYPSGDKQEEDDTNQHSRVHSEVVEFHGHLELALPEYGTLGGRVI